MVPGLHLPPTRRRWNWYTVTSGSAPPTVASVGFQQFTACICLLARFVAPKLWGPSRGATSSYIDDCFIVAASSMLAVLSGTLMVEIIHWLGGQISPSKVELDCADARVLGIRIVSTPKARKFCVPEDKAGAILPVLLQLRTEASTVLQATLETCVGQLAFLAYLSEWGSRYTYPLYAIQWIPMGDRTSFIASSRTSDSDLAAEIRCCLDWWIRLLKSEERVLWSSDCDPLQWIVVNSDACPHGWCATDYNGHLFAGGILDSTKKAISCYEMLALRKYIEWAKPKCRTGIVFLCDNTNVVHTVRKKYSRSPALRKEYNHFADLCELMSLRCICKYVSTKQNMLTDLGSRCRPFLAAALAAALRQRRMEAGDDVEGTRSSGPYAATRGLCLPSSRNPCVPSDTLDPLLIDMNPSMLAHALMELEGRWPQIND